MGMGRVRSTLFRLHRWLGVRLVPFFAALFLSGTVLVFSDELEAAFHPRAWVGSAPEAGARASFGTLFAQLEAAFPGATVFVMERQPQPWLGDRSHLTTATGERIVVWSDPASGTVLDSAPARGLRAMLRAFHDSFLLPGRWPFVLVSASSVLLLLSVASGLVTYRRFWKGLFRPPPRHLGERGRQGGLHRLLGLWSSVFLLIIGSTGLFFMATGLGFRGQEPAPAPASPRLEARPAVLDGARIDAALERARKALPDFEIKVVVLPGRARDGITLAGHPAGGSILAGETTLSLDPLTLEILGVVHPADRQGNARIRALMNALHFGEWGGQWGRALWALLGLTASWLLLSGARVQAARSAPCSRGWLAPFLRGLGALRWVYLLAAAGALALALIRFGPL